MDAVPRLEFGPLRRGIGDDIVGGHLIIELIFGGLHAQPHVPQGGQGLQIFLVGDIDHLDHLRSTAHRHRDLCVVGLHGAPGSRVLPEDRPRNLLAFHRLANDDVELLSQLRVLKDLLIGVARQLGDGIVRRGHQDGGDEELIHEVEQSRHKGQDDNDGRDDGPVCPSPPAVPAPGTVLRLLLFLLRLLVAAPAGFRLRHTAAHRRMGRADLSHGALFRLLGHELAHVVVKVDAGVLTELFQVGQHRVCGGISVVRVGSHGLHGDGLQRLWDGRVQLTGGEWDGIDVLDGYGDRSVPLKGQAASYHLIEHHPRRVQVGAGVNMAPSGLLGGDIMDGAQRLLSQGAVPA